MKIVVYGRQGCDYCTKACKWLDARNRAYTYVDALKELSIAEIAELKTKYDTKTVPIIVINDEFIGGYTELTKLAL